MKSAANLLEARDIAKRFGSVVALRSATLTVRPGEVHALMGANGAGKSTLVKILTGVYPSDRGTIAIRDAGRSFRSPAEARAAGIVSVYQDPALVPDLTVADNMRLADVRFGAVQRWLKALGVENFRFGAFVRDLPYPILRLIDLARALASDPLILLLDEITAALPADLTERVFKVVRLWRERGHSVIFISHRMAEVAALCDRATVLRDGVVVGVTEIAPGSDERIVSLMLGRQGTDASVKETAKAGAAPASAQEMPALEVRGLRCGHLLSDLSFRLRAGEVLGVVALEGQGQQELFDCIAGVRGYDGGEIFAGGKRLTLRHPADAIAAGLVLVPASRLQALLQQRSIRENIALPAFRDISKWGPIPMRRERERVAAAVRRLRIDTRAESELLRLSGGNQQKVVIARWLANGFKTLLCFDATRGIDIGTKHQIYALVHEIAASGSAVLLFTSELTEIPLACDRAIVLFGGKVVDEMPASAADEGTLLRAAHGLGSRVEPGAASLSGEDKAVHEALGPAARQGWAERAMNLVARYPTVFGMPALFVAFLAATFAIHPDFNSFDAQSLAMAALPLCFAAAAQALIVISGGIDLSIGSVMAVSNVLAARTMEDAGFGQSLLLSVLILCAGALIGAVNGLLVVLSRVPDVIVTLSTGFIWGGVALLILEKPGGGAPEEFQAVATGTVFTPWLSNSVILLAASLAIIWIPLRRSKLGLRIYAVGSDRTAAFRSGVNVALSRFVAYVFCGLFSSVGGLSLTMTTGIGSPRSGVLYTLSGLAAVVIGGVSLVGGRGGIFGPVIAAFVLTLIPADLIFMNIDPNFGQVIQGTIIVLVVMTGGFFTLARSRK